LGEEYETEVWLDYALKCKYISEQEHTNFISSYEEVSKMLHAMINNPKKFAPLK
jgi:four helix bundle protein